MKIDKTLNDPVKIPLKKHWLESGLIFWLALLSFGVFIPLLGIYSDDWPFLYVFSKAGYQGVIDFIAWVRPFAGWLFAIPSALSYRSFWAAHVLLLLLRFGDALLFYWMLRVLWPRHRGSAFFAALVFVVFPSFKQQALAVEYFPHFVLFGAYFLSILFMVKALDAQISLKKAWLYWGLSWLLTWGIFPLEYFFGLELIRPVFLAAALRNHGLGGKRLLSQTLRRWLPYLAVVVFFLFWRVFIFQFPSYQPGLIDLLRADFWQGVLTLVRQVFSTLGLVTFGTWLQVFTFPASLKTLLPYAVLTAAALLPTIWLLRRTAAEEAPPAQRFALEWIGIGLLAMLTGGIPFWVTQFEISLNFPWDRPTLSFFVGAALTTIGLLNLIPQRWLRTGLLSLLIALSVGLHFQNALTYYREWESLRSFYWQLTRRIPAMETGTLLVLDGTPFHYHVDRFMTPVLNWIYAPELKTLTYSYSHLGFYKFEDTYLKASDPGQVITRNYGTTRFETTIAKSIFFTYNPPDCLHVVDSGSIYQYDYADFSGGFKRALSWSNLGLIKTGAAPVKWPNFLGKIPGDPWCLLYQQADLARQRQDWEQILGLYQQVTGSGLQPRNPLEWAPYLEALIRANRLEEAAVLTAEFKSDNERNALCAWMEKLEGLGTDIRRAALVTSGCRAP